jgi:eukaryotic-like serine/threonine-protein kinase
MSTLEMSQKEWVLQEIRRFGDIPAMADTIRQLQDNKAFEDQNITEIANIILKDYALTTKLLKVVNSVIYLAFGEVTTISRAIFLLGIGQIKDIALSLMIYDHLQKHGSNPVVLETIGQAFFGGFLAQNIILELKLLEEEEEGFICALLHSLGKIMVAFVMPEKVAEIKKYSIEMEIAENSASIDILGISFEEIGTTIASEWNFPRTVIRSMHNIRLSDITADPGEKEKLSLIATLSSEISNVLAADSAREEKRTAINKLLKLYKDHIDITHQVDQMITSSARNLNKLASGLNLDLTKSFFNKQLNQWSAVESGVRAGQEVLELNTGALKTIDTFFGQEDPEDAETIFSRGIKDINSAMLQPYALNDVTRIVLETIHRGMQGARVLKTLFLVRDIQKPVMKIRFGFGDHIEEARHWFFIELGGLGDVFNVAISKGTDLMVKDLYAPEIKRLIPSWYRKNVFSPLYLVLLPITVDSKNIGLICLEGEQEGFKHIAKGHLNYLRILRDQIVLAISRLAPQK